MTFMMLSSSNLRADLLRGAVARWRYCVVSSCRSSSKLPSTKPEKLEENSLPEKKQFPALDHVTQEAFKSTVDEQRRVAQHSEEDGVKPTPKQRYLLYLTRLYKSREEIPEYVGRETMKKMHNRIRALVVFSLIIVYFSFRFLATATELELRTKLTERERERPSK